MTAQEWVSTKLVTMGRSWVEAHYHDHKKECDKPVSTETYARHIRRAVVALRVNTPNEDVPTVDHEAERSEPMTSSDVATVDDLKDYTRLDSARFEVERGVVNTWGSAKNPNKQVKLSFRPRSIPRVEDLLQDFQEHAAKYAPRHPKKTRPAEQSGNLLEIALHDIHYGQLSWNKETRGADWDIKIAEQVFMNAVEYFAEKAQAYHPDRILFPIGSDFFNSDTIENTTTHGTRQDEDTRWMKTFSLGWKMAVAAIDILSSLADVDIVVIRGNHDEQRAFYMGEALSAWYRNSKNVCVDNSPPLRKYYRHGACLLGLTHGAKESLDALPLLMATEVPDLWSATSFREIHVGHLHHSATKSFQQATERTGVRVQIIPSLVAASAWAADKGYAATREAQAHVWNTEHGKVASIFFHPGKPSVLPSTP